MTKYTPPTFDQLLAKLAYLSAEERDLTRRAYDLAARLHDGQTRSSGDPYIVHPLAVCDILADLRSDAETLAAGFLHDVVEDCGYPLTQIEQEFGQRVMKLVAGVTKLSTQTAAQLEPTDTHGRPPAASPPSPTRQEEWAENMRRLFMSSVEHPLILVIKLADRLHNMRTLEAFESEQKRQRIARETLDIFAPVANRLGMWQIKWELEDLAFRHLQPSLYQSIKEKIAQRRPARERFINRIIHEIEGDAASLHIAAEVTGRPKHIYSTWQKMQRKGIGFEKVYDVHGFRVLVETEGDCYTMLGLVHRRWPPIPGELDDYIGNPKSNGYRSLHTAVVGPDNTHMEVQIRTHAMHAMAEQGVAAHWLYKEAAKKEDPAFANKVAWLRALSSYEDESSASMMEAMRSELFEDRVYVFTPKGDLLDLPTGATPVDFAYHIHTEVGHHCRGARVNGKMVRLDYQLQSHDRVEIVTAKQGGPSRDWLNPHLGYVRTSRARTKIKQWLRKQNREQNIAAGRQSLDRLLKQLNLRTISHEDVALALDYDNLDDLLAAIGYGDIPNERIAGHLINLRQQAEAEARASVTPEPEPNFEVELPEAGDAGITVRGVDGLLTNTARCCRPLPGEPIVGYITRGRGVTIHRQDCANVLKRNEPERLIQVDWGPDTPTYPVPVLIKAWNRAGLLHDITAVVAAEGINISDSNTSTSRKSPIAAIHITMDVRDVSQLTRVLQRIERVQNVFLVERMRV